MESTSEKVKEEESPPSDAQPTDRPNLSGECLDLLRKKMISDLSLKVFRNDLESKITKMEPLQISKERQSVIDNILEQISKLSDPEKLLLFLKLPSPTTERIDPLKQ